MPKKMYGVKDDIQGVLIRVRRGLLYALILVAFFALVLVPIITVVFKHNQVEAETCLMGITTAQFSHYGDGNRYTDNFNNLSYSVDSQNYIYFLSPDSYIGLSPEDLDLSLPIDFAYFDAPVPGLTEDGFIAVAIGNVDFDDSLDVWWIDQRKQPENVENDVSYFETLVDLVMGNWYGEEGY